MAKKSAPQNTPETTPFGDAVKESAQQIWQAGLGAFARAQAQGNKAFETLVQEGMQLQRKTQQATTERLHEATARMSSMAHDISNRNTGQWDKLESIFEDRVARALQRLGLPSAQQLHELELRIQTLENTIATLQKPAPAKTAPVRKTGTARTTKKAKAND